MKDDNIEKNLTHDLKIGVGSPIEMGKCQAIL